LTESKHKEAELQAEGEGVAGSLLSRGPWVHDLSHSGALVSGHLKLNTQFDDSRSHFKFKLVIER